MLLDNHRYFHWLYFSRGKRLVFIVGFGLFVWLFLGLTLPFGIYDHSFSSWPRLMLHLLPFGVVWVIVIFLVDLLARRQKAWENHKVDLWFWALKYLVAVHLFWLLRSLACDWLCMNIWEYAELWLANGILFLLAYLPFSLYGRYRYFRQLVGKPKRAEVIRLLGNSKEQMDLDVSQLLFMTSDGNYVEIWSEDGSGKTGKRLIRVTLSSLEEQLKKHPQVFRTHRSYLVNLARVTKVKKKELHINCGEQDFLIPVSRKYRPGLQILLDS